MAKKHNCKTLLSFHAALLFFLCFSPGMATAATMLDFFPPEQVVELGQQASVDVYVHDLDGNRVGAFDFNIDYDSSVLSLDSIAFGNGLGASVGSFQDVQVPHAGQVNVMELAFALDLSLFQDGFSDVLLFSLTFDTIATGVSSLGFSENILGMSGGYLADEFGVSIGSVGTGNGQITVVSQSTTVPEPGTLLLLVAGLAGLVYRKKASFNSSAH